MIESLPGQLPLFADDDAGPFKLDDEQAELLRAVGELPEAAARGLLFLVLCIMFAQDAAESAEASEPGESVEAIARREAMLPASWTKPPHHVFGFRIPAWM